MKNNIIKYIDKRKGECKMNEFIKILEEHEDKYFYGKEKSLTPFVSGEFLQKFKETIFAGDTHCKYNFNGKCYSEFTITYKKSPFTTKLYRIESLEIQINKKGNKYEKVKFRFFDGLQIDKIKKIFIGHVEIRAINKEKFYNLISNSEILPNEDFYDEEEYKIEAINEYRNDTDKIEEIYNDYLVAIDKYNKSNSERICVDHKFGAQNKFYFDLYGNLKSICICGDYGYETYVEINIVEINIKEEQASEENVEEIEELAPASEKSINELINLFK